MSIDTNHPAHAIQPCDDYEPAAADADIDEVPEQENFTDGTVEEELKPWRLALLMERLPLHHAAITLSDDECLKFFQARKADESVVTVWTSLDRSFNNILHITARKCMINSVCWLLQNSDHRQVLSLGRNVLGYTPIEELGNNLESLRTRLLRGSMTVDVSDRFSGFSAEAVSCLAVLQGLHNLAPIQLKQLKFGCTCGLCIDGFLSPRMKFALLCQAEITHDQLNDDVDDGEEWCMCHDYLIADVAVDIQRNFTTNKSYRQGFSNLFAHVATVLRDGKSPTIENVLEECTEVSEWPPHTKNFFGRGGQIASALRPIFRHALEQSKWVGDYEHEAVFEEQIDALPECRNDYEFGCVALACGIPDLMPLY